MEYICQVSQCVPARAPAASRRVARTARAARTRARNQNNYYVYILPVIFKIFMAFKKKILSALWMYEHVSIFTPLYQFRIYLPDFFKKNKQYPSRRVFLLDC